MPGAPLVAIRVALVGGARSESSPGVALVAGGIGLVVPATARLAGLLSGAMIFSWVFLVHIPRALETFPGTTGETTAVFEAIAMSGIAWLAAVGVNAVRIPVGHWIFGPPYPYHPKYGGRQHPFVF